MTSRPPAADLVIFDLDGTLADTAPDIAAALNQTLGDVGLPPLPVETVIGYVGDGAANLIERALPPEAHALDRAPLLEAFLAHYEARPCVGSRLYPGIQTLLDALNAAGVATAVLTNKTGFVARRLLQVILPRQSFVAVIGDRDGFPRKPDPAAGRHIIERARTTPDRTVMIGDGLPDQRLAHALGVRSLAAGWGYTPRARLAAESPTWLADDPTAAQAALFGAAPP